MRTDLLTKNTKICWMNESTGIMELENEHGVWWRMQIHDYLDHCLKAGAA